MENYFEVLELSIGEIQGQDEATIESTVNAAHKRLYAFTTGSYANVPRPDGKTQGQWQTILNEAKATLIDPLRRNEHIAQLTRDQESRDGNDTNEHIAQLTRDQESRDGDNTREPIDLNIDDFTMERAREVLGNLIDYKAISEISPLQLPTIEKTDIPKFILCQNLDKSLQRAEQVMELQNNKVSEVQGRVRESEAQIKDLEKALRKVDPGSPPTEPGSFLGPSETAENIRVYNKQVAEYNDRLRQARRLQERISDAIDRHGDIVERCNDAIREAQQREEELAAEAILAIDDDIVAVSDKITTTARDLANSNKASDVIAAVEICFIELKLVGLFEEHIDRNDARRMVQDGFHEVNSLCTELSKITNIRNIFASLFGLNRDLIVKNADLHSEIVDAIQGVDQGRLSELTEPLSAALKKQFYTSFKYEGIIDPNKLDSVVAEMHKTMEAIKDHIPQVTDLDVSTQSEAEAAVVVHQTLESTLSTMKSNVEEAHKYLLSTDGFICQMLQEEVIENFYSQDLRLTVTDLRKDVVEHIGAEQFDTIVTEVADRYSIVKTEAAIKAADLLRLQNQRDRVAEYVSELSAQIKDVEAHVISAAEVPKKNADAFRSSTSLLYILSCFPILGFAFAIGILNKVKKFAPAFRSSLEIYQKLGSQILAKNETMSKVILILAAVLGFGGIGIFFGTGVGVPIAANIAVSPIAVNIGLPGGVMILYLITWIVLSKVGKTIQFYVNMNQEGK